MQFALVTQAQAEAYSLKCGAFQAKDTKATSTRKNFVLTVDGTTVTISYYIDGNWTNDTTTGTYLAHKSTQTIAKYGEFTKSFENGPIANMFNQDSSIGIIAEAHGKYVVRYFDDFNQSSYDSVECTKM